MRKLAVAFAGIAAILPLALIGAAPTEAWEAAPIPLITTTSDAGRVFNVATSAQLSAAIPQLIAGDTVVLANGNYSIGTVNGRVGTADRPIVIRAATRGGAVITGGGLQIKFSSYVIVMGLKWTNSSSLRLASSHHIQVTRNHFRLTDSDNLKWVEIGGANSHHNRIDHNLFENKSLLGNVISIYGSDTAQSQYDLIDHNHFRNVGPRNAANGMETIRVGWSEISRSSGFTTIEHNLFEQCDGDPEIISVKSGDNTVRYNTFLRSQGAVTARSGDRSAFYGNFFLGAGKAGTGGIRLYGQDHKIYNNYFEGLTGNGASAAIQIDGSEVDTSGPLTLHWRVYRALVVNNLFNNNVSNIEVGRKYSLPPVDSVIADNVVVGSAGKLFAEYLTPVRLTYRGNIAWPTGTATVGVSQPVSAIRVVDPLLQSVNGLRRLGSGSPAINAAAGGYAFVTDDMDGQPRPAARDTGADEFSSAPIKRKPLTPQDVGVNAP